MEGSFEKGGEGRKVEDRVSSGYFEEALDGLQFDSEVLKSEMYEALASSQSNAFTLIRWEAKNSDDNKPITREQFNDFIQVNGGEAFLRQIFDNGVKGLRRNFQSEPTKFKKYTDALSGKKGAYEKLKFIDARGKTVYKTRYEIMQGSGMLDSMKRIAKSLGKEAKDLTFDEAFDNGFYNEYFQPTLKGAAGYGLTWWEYKDKGRRQKMESHLSRQKFSDTAVGGLLKTADEEKDDGKSTERARKVDEKIKLEREVQIKIQMLERMKEDLVKVLGRDAEDFKRGQIELKYDTYEEGILDFAGKKIGIKYPAVGFYKDGKLLFAVEIKFDDKDGRAVYLLRDPRKDRDIEFATKPDSKNLKDAVNMAWFIRRKIENPTHSEQELRDGLETVTGLKGLRFYVTKEEAKKAGYIEFDEDTKTWKPIEGYQFLDKRKNSTNYAIEFNQDSQNQIKLDAAEVRDFISSQIAYYKDQGVDDLEVSQLQRDQFGNIWFSCFRSKGKERLFFLDLKYAKGKVVYDFNVEGSGKVRFENFPALRTRIGNFLKKNIKVDLEKAGRLAEKRQAESKMEVKVMKESMPNIGVEDFNRMMELAYGEMFVSGGFHGQAARVFYMNDGEAGLTYKFQFERTYKDGKYDLQVKVFAGSKKELVFKSPDLSFENIYQEGRRGLQMRKTFAGQLRTFWFRATDDFRNNDVSSNEYSVSENEVRNFIKSREK